MQQWIDGWVSISRVGQPKENRSNLALTHKLSKVQQAISATFPIPICPAIRICFPKSVDNHISICRFKQAPRIFPPPISLTSHFYFLLLLVFAVRGGLGEGGIFISLTTFLFFWNER